MQDQGFSTSGWHLHAADKTGYTPLALANGMIGLVASVQDLHFDQVILNGVYDRYGRGNVSNIVQGIRFADLDLLVGDASAPGGDATTGWQQTLDMQRGELITRFILNGRVQVEQRACALRHLPYMALVTLDLTALCDVALTLTHTMTMPDILHPLEATFKTYGDVPLLSAVADSPTGRHRIAATASYLFDGPRSALHHEIVSAQQHRVSLALDLKQGETYRFALVGATCTTAHFHDPANEAERLATFAYFEGRERLRANHARAWADLWQGDIQIEGDLQAQRDVRFALYNLYSFVRTGSGCSLSPMGLSGTGYNGHVFWDCELWMYPPLLLLQPEIARSLLDYRFERLPQARHNALSHGFKGAMFPWESDDTGEESTPTWAFTGSFEHHITACVGIAFWNYYCVTQDKAWLAEKGYPLLKEVAEFWLSRVDRNDEGQYEIRNVIGADEYTDVVDNNAFTNGAAIVVLRCAAQAARALGREPNPQWEFVAKGIVLRQFASGDAAGVTQEYDGYDGRVIKQADVNLLAYPLNLIADEAQVRRDLAYYEPRMDTDAPAMSHSVLAVISARLGEAARAHELFKHAYQPNQKPPFGVLSETPFSGNPYFATAAGGMLQAVLAGFAGLDITPEGIVQNKPCLPPEWTSLTVTGVGIKRESFTSTK